ncbi:uncharacterized protein LOC120330610 [Styela clava]
MLRIILLLGFFFMANGWAVVDLCKKSTDVFEYDGYDWFSRQWYMTANNCVYKESALILRLNTMSLTYNGDCKASLKISAFQNNRELCEFQQGLCFVVVSTKSSLSNRTLINGCILIFQDSIVPVVVDFSKGYYNRNMKLNVGYEYIMNEENILDTPMMTATSNGVTEYSLTTTSPTTQENGYRG